jgi:hypothetical protein
VVKVDRTGGTITVNVDTPWTQGAGVSLPWNGAAPDPGIKESR